uniref:Calmodulin binding transcription activator 1 n=1 Tax=Molossus molossus TaxID=27622 RepID=A0A7J8F6N7_MOLMO|nr:calmodulin binding transcription activator 1 [Molossus molossus]
MRKPAHVSKDFVLDTQSVSQSVFCGTSTYCVLNTVPPLEDDHGNSNSSHVKIFLPKKLLECLPKCSSLPKERHRWNTNEMAASQPHCRLHAWCRPNLCLVLDWLFN